MTNTRKNDDMAVLDDEQRWSLPVHQARSRETRDRLLAAAERVFEEKGYEGARIADIAEIAGCSVGAVYVRFKDKDALFRGIVADFSKEAGEILADEDGVPLSTDPVKVIELLVRGASEQFRTHRGLFRAIMERGFDDASAFAPIVAIRRRIEVLLEEVLKSALARNHRDVGLSVRVVSQMVFGFLLNTVVNPYAPTKREAPRAIAELETAVLKYLDLA